MDIKKNKLFVDTIWDQSIIPTLSEYIRIPNKSPMFDSKWREHGYMDKAVKLLADWCQQHAIENMFLEIVQLENRTPILFIDIPGSSDDTILLYGHLDKQPEMSGWNADLGPWKPVLRDNKLYGRGAADDGYAVFASLTAIKSLREQQLSHARCVILIEACEESGSYDLPFYIDALSEKIGTPSLIICLDSGCGNYDQLWITTSLRGMIGGSLHIEILKQGIHSGLGSGIVPSCFLILRQLLARVENDTNSQILLDDLSAPIPTERIKQSKKAADVLGNELINSYPFVEGVQPVSLLSSELILNRTWRPALSIIGVDGLPSSENAGNVTLPSLSAKLSMRLPPTCDANQAAQSLKSALEITPPFHAKVNFEITEAASGWNAPSEAPWLSQAANEASTHYFGKETVYIGEGGSIPFMGMLGKKFPKAQFLITGLLGPESNAHGPNEFLHISAAKNLTCCIAEVISKHYQS